MKATSDPPPDGSDVPAGYDPKLFRIRHSLAHIMAQAVLEKYPDARFAIGPPTANGFYYDFEIAASVTPEDLAVVEKRMREIVSGRHDFKVRVVDPDEARELFARQPYKLELIEGLVRGSLSEDGEVVVGAPEVSLSVYEHDGFVDLCRGPHVSNTREIDPKAFKLLHTAGAYWRGDASRPMLVRIYGTAWLDRAGLDDYLNRLEIAKRRDHRKLGAELRLFDTDPMVGSGLPLWLPRGAAIRRCLEEYILRVERREGYQHVYSPCVGKKELYLTSGHWAHYQENMFPPMEIGGETFVLRPMNCPHHIVIYKADMQSYRDLPLRMAELGTMFRYEKSGSVSGLSRVRMMTLNDAHIFCRPDQVQVEFGKVVKLVEEVYRTLGITDYSYRLSLGDPNDKKKYVDNPAMWEMGERMLREALDEVGVPYTTARGEAAFYGPKLDIQLRDVLGHEETISTVQLDFHLPTQFDLSYVAEDSTKQRPVIIHRAIVSTMERMIAYLIELYEGAFPPWLAPVQVVFIPVADRHQEHAARVAALLSEHDVRVEVDGSAKRMGAKIRQAELQKIPYIVVVGDREVESGTVSVRLRSGEQLAAQPAENFVAMIRDVVQSRQLSPVPDAKWK